ncbi:cytochrome P450 [Kineosporia sp. J2-2]|uniref:Cytochrome P450 n=1 Tax=Kineosporia corallincola TaxID=2835133 RepID=A0ABS5TT99_9ACTN|nr:cytochrome P450 [Kineosporia corallincola]MBT0774015.1 cytochrome P450 [Kineosporia corallincola]
MTTTPDPTTPDPTVPDPTVTAGGTAARCPVTGASLEDFPFTRENPFAPPARYADLRANDPLPQVRIPTGKTPHLITRYADVRAALAHRAVSSDVRIPAFPAMGAGEQEAAARTRPFIRTDPPEHTKIRRMLVAEFTMRRTEALRPRIRATAERQLDLMQRSGESADLVKDYANVLSTTTVLELFGAPAQDVEFFRDVTRVSGGRDSTAEEVNAALGRLFGVLNALIDERRANPGDDLMSALVSRYLMPELITRQELLSTVGITIVAGRETTTSMITLGALYLSRNPRLRDGVLADPSLWPPVIEELLRVLSVADTIPLRVSTAPVELSGGTVPAGEGIVALLAAANHDPAEFPDPDRVDPDRTQKHHLAFGHGIHQCLGQNLARVELHEALAALFGRMPALHEADPQAALDVKPDSATYGLESLRVAW